MERLNNTAELTVNDYNLYEERAAILEYDANIERAEAEKISNFENNMDF